jgi:hypothetical protein
MVGGYVWARYICYGSTIIILALIVNTHLAEVSVFEYLRGRREVGFRWVTCGHSIVVWE